MKVVSSIMLTLGVGAGLISAVVSPSAPVQQDNAVVAQAVKAQPQVQHQDLQGAIRVIAPQKDLENAIRMSEKGDVLVLGPEGWYRIEARTLQQGTRVYILSQPGTMVSVFPKEAETNVR